MQKYIIGVDTGGTFTDAVLLDSESGRVIATAKKPATRCRLAGGTGNALTELLKKSGMSCTSPVACKAENCLVNNRTTL